MIEPYRMVVVNVLALLALLAGLLFYRYVFPKKSVGYLVPILLFSFLPVISILRKGDYESGDFNMHVYRSIAFFDALKEGHVHPVWPKDLNATYGYPVYLFAAPAIYYISSFFHVLGLSFIGAMKMILATSFIASAITMYLWAKKEFGKEAGFVSAIFYLFAPFHLVDLHFRVSPGGIILYAAFPLSLLFAKSILVKPSFRTVTAASFTIAFEILAHPLALLSCFFYGAYLLFTKMKLHAPMARFLIALSPIIGGLALSAFYWLPLTLERVYTFDYHYSPLVSFTPIWEFLYSPWRLGFLYQGHEGELSFVLGYIHLIVLVLCTAVFLLRKKVFKKDYHTVAFYLFIFYLLFFLMLNISEPIWKLVPVLNTLQFSYRLMFFTVFVNSVIAGLLLKHFSNKYIWIICVITVGITILNWGHRRVIPEITDQTLRIQLAQSTASGEGGSPSVPIWRPQNDPWMVKTPEHHLEIIDGKGNYKELVRQSQFHQYIVNAQTPLYIKENTLFYPGWTLELDGKKRNINYQNQKFPGIITFKIEKGLHLISLTFEQTKIRYTSELVTLFTFFGFLITTIIFTAFSLGKKQK